MKTLQEKIAVMQAAADGKEIQWMEAGTDDNWVTLSAKAIGTQDWNWEVFDFRVKPREPKVIYVNEYAGSSVDYAYYQKSDADYAARGPVLRKAIKYREVIDEQEN